MIKPSLYRMVLRYVNKGPSDVFGNIKVIPDNPNDNEQEISAVQFKISNTPNFITISVPLVMNPGRWTFRFKVEKNLLLVRKQCLIVSNLFYAIVFLAGLFCSFTRRFLLGNNFEAKS